MGEVEQFPFAAEQADERRLEEEEPNGGRDRECDAHQERGAEVAVGRGGRDARTAPDGVEDRAADAREQP